MEAVNITNLKKTYNNIAAVDIPRLNINRGEVVGIVGNNGAGKTTLLRLCLDLIKATQGQVSLNGFVVSNDDSWKKITGSYLDTNFLMEFLSAKEFLYFIGDVYRISKAKIDERKILFEKFMTDEIIGNNKFIHELSSGNKQKVGVISAMIIYPEILILDEPFNFLDPSSQFELKKLLKELNTKNKTTIIVSSHNIEHIIDLSTRIVLMEKGLIIKDMGNEIDQRTARAELEKYFMTI
ncbi:MAG: ABC transporter ATP-binding protein [Dysgonamonadaceae bacterium]|jgi:ABC-2 type transport system ATP-binding protein|nr:ABC transporter ATP-binding protein [Dysgonamonadaceae bacterium]